MKKVALTFATLCALSNLAFAGTYTSSSKEMAPAVCPSFYADSEVNLAIWGAFAFAGDNNDDLRDFNFNNNFETRSDMIHGAAFGGGVDLKYFFRRYFGVGVEGFGLGNFDRGSGRRRDILKSFGFPNDVDSDGAGAALATFTFRYPFPCSRWAPYAFVGIGGIWGGNDTFEFIPQRETFVRQDARAGSILGQIGGGIEYRFSQHVAAMTDITFNIDDENDFGMARLGFNFSF